LRQLVGNDPGSADFLEADLGMRVQIPADRGEFVGEAFDAVDVGQFIFIRLQKMLNVIWLRE